MTFDAGLLNGPHLAAYLPRLPLTFAFGSGLMQKVVLRVGSDGAVWVTCQCRGCGHVHDGRAAQAILAPVVCQQCQRSMDIRGAIIEAAEPSQPRET
jgi:hypothetical protein